MKPSPEVMWHCRMRRLVPVTCQGRRPTICLSALALSVVLGPFAPDPCQAVLTVGCSGPRKGSDMGGTWWIVGLWSEIY